MQKQGKWVEGKTAIGYMKDPNDKNKLIICEPEAEIVKTIFDMAISGKQVGVIRDYLNTNNIPTANKSRYNKNIKNIVKEFLELRAPSLEVMRVIINRIEIHQDKQVDIVFNFKKINVIFK